MLDYSFLIHFLCYLFGSLIYTRVRVAWQSTEESRESSFANTVKAHLCECPFHYIVTSYYFFFTLSQHLIQIQLVVEAYLRPILASTTFLEFVISISTSYVYHDVCWFVIGTLYVRLNSPVSLYSLSCVTVDLNCMQLGLITCGLFAFGC